MNVLITSVSKKVSLVKAFKKTKGIDKVMGIDIDPLSPAAKFVDEFIICPQSDTPYFYGFIFNLCKEFKIDLIIPTRNGELGFFAEHIEYFSNTVVVASEVTIRICDDKGEFSQFCLDNNFEIPHFFCEYFHYNDGTWRKNPDNYHGSVQFPIIVKSRYGSGSKNTIILNNKLEAEIFECKRKTNNYKNKYIYQECINAPEYSIDLFADFDGNIISVVPRERIKVVGGESYISKTVDNDFIIKEVCQLAKALKLIGHNVIQCFLHEGKVKFIEVNARFGGASCLGIEAGCNSPAFLVKLLNGEKLEPIIGEYNKNLTLLKYTEDIYI